MKLATLGEIKMASGLGPYPEDIVNRVNHDFRVDERPRAFEILAGAKGRMFTTEWIQLAALRAAEGKVELLQQWIDLSNKDERDLKMALSGIAGADWEWHFILYSERQ
jgi:hypothetical protein